MQQDEENEDSADDSGLRAKLSEDGFKPDASAMKYGKAHPKILVAGAYKVIRTAAEKARAAMGIKR